MKLNLGCGETKIEGFVGVDRLSTAAVDVIHNLDIFPYPFEGSSVDEIMLDNVLEHLNDVIMVMEEIYRISRPGAVIKIKVPYFKSNSAYTDPTHKHFFTETSFKYYDKDNPLHFYTTAEFKVLKVKLIQYRQPGDYRHLLRNLVPFKRILNYFLFNIYDEIYFELECVKNVV
jgi:SAM-dependent methyltransferase